VDPTQLQTDTTNDPHSLEGGNAVVEGVNSGPNSELGESPSGTTAATLGSHALATSNQPPASPSPSAGSSSGNHRPLWQRLNIYVLLFVLLVVIASGIVAGYFIKSNKATTKGTNIASQGLSQSTLQQLANTDVTVGSSQQTLNVASNAVFAGGVLIRSNLEVAGAVAIGGTLTLPGITVSGASQLGQVNANGLSVSGLTTVQGVLTAKNGLNVSGNSTFNGSISAASVVTGTLTIGGDLVLTHHITAGGAIPSLSKGPALGGGGSASVSGSDTSGTVIINAGTAPPAGCFATVTFATAFSATPHVVITPIGASAGGVNYYVNRSTTSFTICGLNAAPASQTFGFDYMVLD